MALNNTEASFFEFLVAEFETNFSNSSGPQVTAAKDIIARYRDDSNKLTKSDIYALDMIILGLQPMERLVQRAGSLRIKYRELAGQKLASVYEPTPLPSPDKYNDSAERLHLYADLQQLLSFIHWNYFFTPIREGIRKAIIKKAIFFMIAYTVIWGSASAWFLNEGNAMYFHAIVASVMYAGLIGGYISSQRRMQLIPNEGDPLASIYELENGQYFLWFSPLTGAVFAVVLMLLFISGIVQGKIFPAFFPLPLDNGTTQVSCWTLTQLMPKTGADYALLFLWSFVAGFAERFVPDALDRIVSRADDVIKTIPSSPGSAAQQVTLRPEELHSGTTRPSTKVDATVVNEQQQSQESTKKGKSAIDEVTLTPEQLIEKK